MDFFLPLACGPCAHMQQQRTYIKYVSCYRNMFSLNTHKNTCSHILKIVKTLGLMSGAQDSAACSCPDTVVRIITHTGSLVPILPSFEPTACSRAGQKQLNSVTTAASEVAAERDLSGTPHARPSRGVVRVFRHTPSVPSDVYEEVYCWNNQETLLAPN